MKNPNVCILTSVHPPLDTRIFYKEAKTLQKNGMHITIIAPGSFDRTVDGIEIKSIQKPRNRLERIFFTTLRTGLKAFRQSADIYHFHDPELMPVCLLIKLITSKKVIYDVHEDVPKDIMSKYWIPERWRRPVSLLVSFLQRSISHFFDTVITATEDIKGNFKSHRNCVVVNNFPLLESFVFLDQTNTRSGSPQAIYVGALSPERGISEIIQAMSFLPSRLGVRLVLCGDFSPASYGEEIKKLKGYERVEYLGFVEPKSAWAKMAESDLGLVCFHPEPNHLNAMPNKIFEYMAAGVPIVASNFPLWKTIIEENNCGILVDPKDPVMIARAIEKILTDSQSLKEMGANGKIIVMKKYNWEVESKKLLEIYQKLLA